MNKNQKIWIRGISGKRNEIISILKKAGGIDTHCYDGDDEDFIFYITPKGYIDYTVDGSEVSDLIKSNYREYIYQNGVFLKKEQKIWIKSNMKRGKEVIDKLLSLGATNPHKYYANLKECTFFIAPDGTIHYTQKTSLIDTLVKENYKEYKLPKKTTQSDS